MIADKLNRWLMLAVTAGILISLVMLLIEVREAINLSEAEAYRNRGDDIQRSMQELALSPDLAQILAKARDGEMDALSENERIRLWAWEFAKSVRMQNQFNDHTLGYLDDASYRSMISSAAAAYPLWQMLGVIPGDARFRQAIEAQRASAAVRVPDLEQSQTQVEND